MKVIKTAKGNEIKLSKSEWETIGKTAGWMKKAEDGHIVDFAGFKCRVVKAQYGNGATALQLVDAEDSSPIARATVNIPEVELGENEVIIKDYSENEGMLDALVEAGICVPTGQAVQTGHITAPICKLLI